MKKRKVKRLAAVLLAFVAFTLAVAPAGAASIVDESIIPGDTGVAFVDTGTTATTAGSMTPTRPAIGANDAYQMTRAVTPLGFLFAFTQQVRGTITSVLSAILPGAANPALANTDATATNTVTDDTKLTATVTSTNDATAQVLTGGVAHRAGLVSSFCGIA